MTLDTIEDAIAAIAAGQCVVVVDDEDRENEGDLVMAASKMSKESMAFMIRAGGLVCAPITATEARRLKLDPMARENDAPLSTAFTVSIDYREDLTTGISAAERSSTVRALANNNVQADDFVRPGHIFPLVAKDGGVLMRSGHTEAAVDLARLAGEPPVGVICEILGEDGETLKGDPLFDYARKNDLKVVSIADLIHYRQQRETLVSRVAEFTTETEAGPAQAIVYSTPDQDGRVRGGRLRARGGGGGYRRCTLVGRRCHRVLHRAVARVARRGAGGANPARSGGQLDPPAGVAGAAICRPVRLWRYHQRDRHSLIP